MLPLSALPGPKPFDSYQMGNQELFPFLTCRMAGASFPANSDVGLGTVGYCKRIQ